MSARDTDLGIVAVAALIGKNQCRDACRICLKRQDHQVAQQANMLGKFGRDSCWLLRLKCGEVALLLGLGNPKFQLANSCQVLIVCGGRNRRACRGVSSRRQSRNRARSGRTSPATLPGCFALASAAAGEEAFKNQLRVDFLGDGLGL